MTILTAQTEPPAAPAVPAPASMPLDARDLEGLMRAVNDTAQRLQQTHATLRCEVGRLQGELAEANAELRRSRSLAALGEMAAGIAHEIRNPLASIRLYAQMLGEDLDHVPEQNALCGKIGRAVTDLDRIVRDVLHFARDRSIRPVPTDAETLVEQTLAQATAVLAEHEAHVELDIAPDLDVEADPCLMTQALGNVVRNAVEAVTEDAPERPRLHIHAARRRVRTPGGPTAMRTVIAVDDNGPGIPPAVVERMFNPFFTTRKKGTGLGLAIVHRIVDAHGGHVRVGAAPAGGARVELCLPRRQTPSSRPDGALEPTKDPT